MIIRPELRSYATSLIEGGRQDRESFWVHWRECADFILPRRYRWLITPNQFNRGSPINQHIIDSTGSLAARTLASGMMSGMTSPTRPWFKLRLDGMSEAEDDPTSLWLAEVERRMYRVFAESNFYTAMAVMYFDLVVFGSALILIYEDYDDVISCFNPCAGEYFLFNGKNFSVNRVGREFVMTIAQLVERFGLDNVSEDCAELYKQGGSALGKEVVVYHLVEPNDERKGSLPKVFKYREMYWTKSDPGDSFLELKGFFESPFLAPRWDLTANDAYGRSPGMDALPDIKQLQLESKRKAQAIDKMVNPPMVADVQLKNQPASLLPGGVTYVSNLRDGVGFKPAYVVNPQIREMMEDLQEVRGRVKDIFYNDLFRMISDLETVRTATEIDARKEEKLILMGPVIERFQREALDPAIRRVFQVMTRLRLLPPPPPGLNTQHVQIKYVSMLAEAQRAVASGSLERFLSLLGNLAAVKPEVMDKVDTNEVVSIYGDILNVDPRVVRTDEEANAIAQQRAKQQQMQQAAELTQPMAQGAQTLSQVKLNNGQSALDAMLGNQGG